MQHLQQKEFLLNANCKILKSEQSLLHFIHRHQKKNAQKRKNYEFCSNGKCNLRKFKIRSHFYIIVIVVVAAAVSSFTHFT